MTTPHQTVEAAIRAQMSKAFGGARGIAEGAVPTIIFTVCWLVSHELRLSLMLGISGTVLALLLRLAQRSTIQFSLNALVGITVAAIFAARSGEAKDVFLPGIIYNAGYAAVFIISILIGWPLLGFIIGSVTGDPTAWRRDPGIVRLCSQLTWLLVIPCILRVAVQFPLYAGDHIALLGTAKIALGWPLQLAAFLAMAWILSRDATPMASESTTTETEPDSS